MTINSPTAPDRKAEQATIAGIERGLADVKAGRTVSHEAAMKSLRKIIDAAAGDIV
jgi:predicted transcriptional regulator